MVRYLNIFFFTCVIFLPAGCNGTSEQGAFWERVKLKDLIAVDPDRGRRKSRLETLDFNVYVFEMPADAVSIMDDVWPRLYTRPLKFKVKNAFDANFFNAGFGEIGLWDNVAEILRSAGAKKVRNVSIFLSDDQPNNIFVSRIYGRQSVFFVSAAGYREQLTVGPGVLVFRLTAAKIPASRGVCRLKIEPVFSPPSAEAIARIGGTQPFGEVVFDFLGFEVKMSRGDFVLIGQGRYISRQADLAGWFFSSPSGKPAVLLYLIVCAGIVD